LQRHVHDVLYGAEGHELPLRELRRRLGEPDRSNLRRAIRGLLRRGLVEESHVGGERSIKLTFWGALSAHPLPKIPRRPRVSIHTQVREEMRKLQEARKEERRRLEAEGPRWIGYEHRFVRNRPLGQTQMRVLSVLCEHSDPWYEGLPVTAVKALVGGDRSNTRRAIRTLLLRRMLDESEDGERIRLSFSSALKFSARVLLRDGPMSVEHARAILIAHQADLAYR
jgi:hypothetical protein